MMENPEYRKELINNQLRIVMIDRMLKEKYNQIEYLAIQPPGDPNIAEINRPDLDWLLSEHERCEALEKEMTQQRQSLEQEMERQRLDGLAQLEEQKQINDGLREQYMALETEHQKVLNSNAWRWGLRFAKAVHFILTPARALRGKA